MRLKPIIGFLAAVLIGNIVLMLNQQSSTRTRPDTTDNRPPLERLTSQTVASYSELPDAAARAGLRLSRRFISSIDNIARIDSGHVLIGGWLADTDGDGTPLELLAFVGGAVVATTATKGEVPGVAEGYRLGFGAEKNIAFELTVPCRSGEQPVVVGLGPKERYVPLRSPACP